MLDMMGHVGTAMLRRYRISGRKLAGMLLTLLESPQNSNAVPEGSPKVSESEEENSAVIH
jgi:hypothetical protein